MAGLVTNNWETVPEHFFRKRGGLHLLLRCRYHTKILSKHTKFYSVLQRKRKTVPIGSASRRESFKMSYKTRIENKLREFKLTNFHRIVVTKKELKRFGIKSEGDCFYCGKSLYRPLFSG